MKLLTLSKVVPKGNWPDLRCYIMERYMCIFFGPPSDYQIDGITSDYNPEKKIIRRYGRWSYTEVSIDDATGEFISLLLLKYSKPLPPTLDDASSILGKVPIEEGIPIFSYSDLPPAGGMSGNRYEDLDKDVCAQTGPDFICIKFLDMPVERYIRASANCLLGITGNGGWAVAHFHRLQSGSVREFEEYVASRKYASRESIVERFTGFVRSLVS